MTDSTIREGELSVDLPAPQDAGLRFIGRIRTPWSDRRDCPHQGDPEGPECRVELFAPWEQALAGIEDYETVELLYWLDRSRRDLLVQRPNRRDRPARQTGRQWRGRRVADAGPSGTRLNGGCRPAQAVAQRLPLARAKYFQTN